MIEKKNNTNLKLEFVDFETRSVQIIRYMFRLIWTKMISFIIIVT